MNKSLITPLFIFLLWITGCQPAEEKVTREEATKFAADMETAALKLKPDFLSGNIILPALMDRVERIKLIENRDGVEKGVRLTLNKHELDQSLFNVMGKKGTFEKVKLYEKDGRQRVIFRAFGDGGINYLDMELTKFDSKIGVADMFAYLSGENISTTMAELYNKFMKLPASADRSFTQRMEAVKALMRKGNYVDAKREFDYFPANIKSTKVCNILNLQIITNLQDEKYKDEIERLERKYSDEPNVQLLMIDLHILRKNYDKALGAINQIDSVINKDPFLDYYRGLINYMKGDTATAIGCYERVTSSNPSFPGAYAELFALHAMRDEKEKAKKYFHVYKDLRNRNQEFIRNYEVAYPYLKE
jgi:tetratricopeptide (TPR) repeat protein